MNEWLPTIFQEEEIMRDDLVPDEIIEIASRAMDPVAWKFIDKMRDEQPEHPALPHTLKRVMKDARAAVQAVVPILCAGWQPIETAPKNRYIMITDDQYVPDIVEWENERPDRNCMIAAGWFSQGQEIGRHESGTPRQNLNRSRIVNPKWWAPLPESPRGIMGYLGPVIDIKTFRQ
jgi:hypothetical protein